jgi:hypothetical protein
MASLEGLGIQAPSLLVSVESGGCRAFRMPQRHIWRPGERLLAGAGPVASRVAPFVDALAVIAVMAGVAAAAAGAPPSAPGARPSSTGCVGSRQRSPTA